MSATATPPKSKRSNANGNVNDHHSSSTRSSFEYYKLLGIKNSHEAQQDNDHKGNKQTLSSFSSNNHGNDNDDNSSRCQSPFEKYKLLGLEKLGPNAHFPYKLHMLMKYVEQEELEYIISWLPDGKTFKVHDREKFASVVMPQFFNSKNFRSFQRNLSLWGFNTITRGPNKGVTSHVHFIKNDIERCCRIRRHALAAGHYQDYNDSTTNDNSEGGAVFPDASLKDSNEQYQGERSIFLSKNPIVFGNNNNGAGGGALFGGANHEGSFSSAYLPPAETAAAAAAASKKSGVMRPSIDAGRGTHHHHQQLFQHSATSKNNSCFTDSTCTSTTIADFVMLAADQIRRSNSEQQALIQNSLACLLLNNNNNNNKNGEQPAAALPQGLTTAGGAFVPAPPAGISRATAALKDLYVQRLLAAQQQDMEITNRTRNVLLGQDQPQQLQLLQQLIVQPASEPSTSGLLLSQHHRAFATNQSIANRTHNDVASTSALSLLRDILPPPTL